MPGTLSGHDLEAITQVLRTLGHETRLRLVAALTAHGETSVSELEGLTGIGQPGLSQQLAILRKAELVTTRRAAKQVYYSIATEAFGPVAGFIAALNKAGAVAGQTQDVHAPSPARGSAAMFARML